MKTTRILIALASLTTLAACGKSTATPTTDANPSTVRLLAYDAFTPEKNIFNDFTAQTGAKVQIITAGDTGTMVSKAILTAGCGVSTTRFSLAHKTQIFSTTTRLSMKAMYA
jgi:ABC-type thiamine transport system substrate-binding protein